KSLSSEDPQPSPASPKPTSPSQPCSTDSPTHPPKSSKASRKDWIPSTSKDDATRSTKTPTPSGPLRQSTNGHKRLAQQHAFRHSSPPSQPRGSAPSQNSSMHPPSASATPCASTRSDACSFRAQAPTFSPTPAMQ